MRFVSRSLTALLLAALAVALLAWAVQITAAALRERAAEDGGGRPAEERVYATALVALEPGTVTPTLSAFGEIRAVRTLELRAPVGGRVVELAPSWVEGGRVAAGEVLLRIDPAQAEAEVAVARADLAGAEAEVRDAARGLDLARQELAGAEAQRDLQAQAVTRQRDLAQRGVGSAAAVETASLAVQTAEQSILARRGALAAAEARIDAAALGEERARIALREAERDLADRILRAQFDGVLGEASVLEGGLVNPNERLGVLIDPTALEVAFRLSTTQHARLVGADGALVGAPVRAVLDVLGLAIEAPGRVVREAPAVAEGRTGRLVFARLDGAAGFRPGDFVRVEVEEPSLGGVAVLPAAALSPQDRILLLAGGDRLEEVSVDVLRRQGDDVIVAVGDLAGREAVALRSPALGSGIKIRPQRPDDDGDAAPGAETLLALDPERRARLIAFVEGGRMPDAVKARLLARLQEDRVPAEVVARIESRMGS